MAKQDKIEGSPESPPPTNTRGYQGGPLPEGPIKVPTAPAADVPREPSSDVSDSSDK